MANPEFIRGAVNWLALVIERDTPELLRDARLAPFAQVRRAWTGTELNLPAAGVMPRNTTFDSEGSGRHQQHELTVKFTIDGSDPEELTDRAMAYMAVIDRAVIEALWPGQGEEDEQEVRFSNVFIAQHDYGPLYERKGSMFRFPEIHIAVEAYE